MQVLLYIYIGFFALITITIFTVELFFTEADERDPLRETICDFGAALIFLAGMLFYAFRLESSSLRLVWLILAPIAAGYVIYSSFRGRRKQVSERNPGDKPSHFAFADIGTIVFVVPALAISLLFALSKGGNTRTTGGESGRSGD